MKTKITQAELKEIVSYNPGTGVFTSLLDSRQRRFGSKLGYSDCKGYLATDIKNNRYFLHRLAWLYVYGAWPDQIDHINHDGLDNRIENLRSVSHNENMKNLPLRSDNTSGVTGVCWHKSLKYWVVQNYLGGKRVSVLYFKDKFEAICSKKSFNNKHDYHSNHGASI